MGDKKQISTFFRVKKWDKLSFWSFLGQNRLGLNLCTQRLKLGGGYEVERRYSIEGRTHFIRYTKRPRTKLWPNFLPQLHDPFLNFFVQKWFSTILNLEFFCVDLSFRPFKSRCLSLRFFTIVLMLEKERKKIAFDFSKQENMRFVSGLEKNE